MVVNLHIHMQCNAMQCNHTGHHIAVITTGECHNQVPDTTICTVQIANTNCTAQHSNIVAQYQWQGMHKAHNSDIAACDALHGIPCTKLFNGVIPCTDIRHMLQVYTIIHLH